MKAGLAKLQPSLKQTDVPAADKVAIGTVKDLGVDVSPEAFVVAADDVDVIGLSALLTTTMGQMKSTLEAIDAAGKRAKVRVIVGGAPVTEAFACSIGADGYAPDASRAVALAKSLIASAS